MFVFMHPTSTLQPAADADRAGRARAPRAVRRQPLPEERHRADHGEGAARPGRVGPLGARGGWATSKVVLVGWSGGGSLSLLYQARGRGPDASPQTPAGDPVDLAGADLLPADGVIFIAAHLSRAETLTEWMDPSVIDELDPDDRDPELDIYAADAGPRPPFSPEFVATLPRGAGRAQPQDLGVGGRRARAAARTATVPRSSAPSWSTARCATCAGSTRPIDPNDRQPDWCYLGDPRTANAGPVGLARYTTLRSWLSQWSLDHSRASGAQQRRADPPGARCCRSRTPADDAVPGHAQPDRARCARHRRRGVPRDRGRHALLPGPAATTSPSAWTPSRRGAGRAVWWPESWRTPLASGDMAKSGDTSQTLGRGLDRARARRLLDRGTHAGADRGGAGPQSDDHLPARRHARRARHAAAQSPRAC